MWTKMGPVWLLKPPPPHRITQLELVYLPEGKYWVYPRMVYRMAIVMPPG